MILSDQTIEEYLLSERIKIQPYDLDQIQPASYDIRISNRFRVFKNGQAPYIDVRKPTEDLMELHVHDKDQPFMLHPSEFALAASYESITLPDDITARLDGKSSLGRLGLVIHSTAGWIDPGFHGTITLEMSNDATLPITLYPEMLIGQLSFMPMDKPVRKPYEGKYQHQSDPEASKMYQNFEDPTIHVVNEETVDMNHTDFGAAADPRYRVTATHLPTGAKSEVLQNSLLEGRSLALRGIRDQLRLPNE